MTDRWNARLSEYLDGDLDPADRAALEDHLATCDDCRAALAGLRRVAEGAHRLPDRTPERDLWPAIESRLDEPRRVLALPALMRNRRVTLSLRRALAVAAALVLVSAAAAWWTTRLAARRDAALAGRAATPSPAAAPALVEDARYDATVAELRSEFESHKAELDTSTVRVVEMNLAIIDRAMADARRALAADPANPYLNEHLRRQMDRKVELLRLATAAGVRTERESRS